MLLERQHTSIPGKFLLLEGNLCNFEKIYHSDGYFCFFLTKYSENWTQCLTIIFQKIVNFIYSPCLPQCTHWAYRYPRHTCSSRIQRSYRPYQRDRNGSLTRPCRRLSEGCWNLCRETGLESRANKMLNLQTQMKVKILKSINVTQYGKMHVFLTI